ncbi:hypothetical protein HPP92_028808 [Vanilla planifolia]|uniref:Uncharacterized protein n=1 Tax=Vanilla planifolia TaxID=51239 RepID=A0A835P7T9_VANPL|nr:hypothetical protein HPP92_028808 [Vanilla planifolia]KAG0446508.1 hypothetical protein HPP92_028797 [Vanilla planifolia]
MDLVLHVLYSSRELESVTSTWTALIRTTRLKYKRDAASKHQCKCGGCILNTRVRRIDYMSSGSYLLLRYNAIDQKNVTWWLSREKVRPLRYHDHKVNTLQYSSLKPKVPDRRKNTYKMKMHIVAHDMKIKVGWLKFAFEALLQQAENAYFKEMAKNEHGLAIVWAMIVGISAVLCGPCVTVGKGK